MLQRNNFKHKHDSNTITLWNITPSAGSACITLRHSNVFMLYFTSFTTSRWFRSFHTKTTAATLLHLQHYDRTIYIYNHQPPHHMSINAIYAFFLNASLTRTTTNSTSATSFLRYTTYATRIHYTKQKPKQNRACMRSALYILWHQIWLQLVGPSRETPNRELDRNARFGIHIVDLAWDHAEPITCWYNV